jgi:hypothetical protein
MSHAGNCTPSAKEGETFRKCNLKKRGGLKSSQREWSGEMSHAETRESQVLGQVDLYV